ncbi:hypothetical protein BSG1_08286 [Bacillus sp. SG-1]|nr:hypothetical protein BSG1_08286 [Bacillus sp. SG-1]
MGERNNLNAKENIGLILTAWRKKVGMSFIFNKSLKNASSVVHPNHEGFNIKRGGSTI